MAACAIQRTVLGSLIEVPFAVAHAREGSHARAAADRVQALRPQQSARLFRRSPRVLLPNGEQRRAGLRGDRVPIRPRCLPLASALGMERHEGYERCEHRVAGCGRHRRQPARPVDELRAVRLWLLAWRARKARSAGRALSRPPRRRTSSTTDGPDPRWLVAM